MFYWTGYGWLEWEAQPIWFDVSLDPPQHCSFSLHEQFSHHPLSMGSCSIDEDMKNPVLTFRGNHDMPIQFLKVDDFGAGEMEPYGVEKWADETGEFYVWMTYYPENWDDFTAGLQVDDEWEWEEEHKDWEWYFDEGQNFINDGVEDNMSWSVGPV